MSLSRLEIGTPVHVSKDHIIGGLVSMNSPGTKKLRMFVDSCIQDGAVAGGASMDLTALPHQAAGPAPRAPLAPPPVRALLKAAGGEHQG